MDPRINNNEAYRLAVEVGNEEIINIISELIIRKTWHEKQALIQECESLIGPSILPDTIHLCLMKVF